MEKSAAGGSGGVPGVPGDGLDAEKGGKVT